MLGLRIALLRVESGWRQAELALPSAPLMPSE